MSCSDDNITSGIGVAALRTGHQHSMAH